MDRFSLIAKRIWSQDISEEQKEQETEKTLNKLSLEDEIITAKKILLKNVPAPGERQGENGMYDILLRILAEDLLVVDEKEH